MLENLIPSGVAGSLALLVVAWLVSVSFEMSEHGSILAL
jgi:hypothetical protein